MIKARIQAQGKERANLQDYHKTVQNFSWDQIEHELGLSSEFNAYEYLITRNIQAGLAHQVGLVFTTGDASRSYSFEEIHRESCSWAGLFNSMGLKKGERVLILAPPCFEAYSAVLGAISIGLVVCPLDPSLQTAELFFKYQNASPSAVVTSPEFVQMLCALDLRGIKGIVYTKGPLKGICPMEFFLHNSAETAQVQMVDKSTPLYLIYTSGSTGPAKGIVHTHGGILSYYVTGRYVLDLKANDCIWTDGPLFWITGLVYGLFTPLLLAVPSIISTRALEAHRCYWIIENQKVTVWYTTPMRLRKLKEQGLDLLRRYDLSSLRHICTVGDFLDPELFYWTKQAFGVYPHDTWWMTETGSIMVANFPSVDLKPGSMGKAVPGIQVDVLDERFNPLPPMSLGELAIKTPWPSMMLEVFKAPERMSEYLKTPKYFLTGDLVVMDEEGYLYHQGRLDDVVKISDGMVGPYEVEQSLMDHPMVLDVAVISKTSKEQGKYLKAFVVLREGYQDSLTLSEELKAFAKARLGLDLPLNEVEFLTNLPKSHTGKVLKMPLKAKELGIPLWS